MNFFDSYVLRSQTQSTDRNTGAIVLCPGFHSSELTEHFLKQITAIHLHKWKILVFPADRYSVYSGTDILRFLHENLNPHTPDAWLKTPVIFIAFSAGVVGAVGAATAFQVLGGKVSALFALDGWGVPSSGDFPIHRISHDHFTHWTSALLGSGQDSFYADPPVEHLALWRSPHTTSGYWISSSHQPTKTTTLQFLKYWLNVYRET